MKKTLHIFLGLIVTLGVMNFFVIRTKASAVEINKSSTSEVIVKMKHSDKLYKLSAAQGIDTEYLLANYNLNSQIEYVEPNFKFSAAVTTPNDPDFIQQYYLGQVQAQAGWDISTGRPEIVVAVLDSGVDIDNLDLKHNIWVNVHEKPFDLIDNDGNGKVDDFYGWNFVDDNNDVKPSFINFTELGVNHGTIVAGILGARGNNGIGITGAAWQIKIMPLKVLDSSGMGDSLTLVRAIDYAISKKVDVINLSVVGHSYSQALQDAISRAWQAGIVIVAAAGNEVGLGQNMDIYPAYPVCNDGEDNMVLGVVALDRYSRLASFSNFGSRCSDVSAPGVNFYSTVAYHESFPGFNHYYKAGFSGTSVATPLVSALAALIKSVNPSLTNIQIRNIILNTASDVDFLNPNYKGKLGSGLVDFGKALGAAKATLSGTSQPISQDWLVVGAGPGGSPHVRIFDWQGNVLAQWFAYDEKFRGGVNVAAGDVNGDGKKDIITAPGAGGGPHIRIFDHQGNVLAQWFAYDEKFRGGVNVAAGDIDNDGLAEIIVAPASGMETLVKIFDFTGHMRFKFLAYADNFTGGASLAVGDVDGDSQADIVTGAGFGGGPHVRIFNRQGQIKQQWFAYDAKFRGGVNVAVGNLSGDINKEIVTTPGPGGGPHTRVFNWQGKVQAQWFAYEPENRTGLKVAVGDMTGDGKNEVLVALQKGSSPNVRIFNSNYQLSKELVVFPPAFIGGVNLQILGR